MSIIKEMRVPDIGDFTEAQLIEIPVTVGCVVAEGDTLIVLETDKSTLEVPADTAGKIIDIAVSLDDAISEGSLIMTIEVEQSDVNAVTPSVNYIAGQRLPGQSLASDMNAVTATADNAHNDHTDVEQAVINTPAGEPSTAQQKPDDTKSNIVYASPSIRRYTRQLGARLSDIEGSGPKHRITREDVERYIKSRLTDTEKFTSAGQVALSGLPDWPKINHERFGSIERIPMSRIAKISGPALTRNAIVIPHVTHFDKTDITELEAFRKNLNNEAAADDAKITLLTFAVKAVVAALKAYPVFNSSLDGDELIIKHYWNIGVAVDTPEGLLVPVVKEAGQKGYRHIANEIAELAAQARAGKLTAGQMQGATFSVSSLGGIGGTNFTPIINAPEVAILGLPRSEIQPVWDGEGFQPRLIQPLSLSFDHRVIDGVAAARFLQHIAGSLNDLRRINV